MRVVPDIAADADMSTGRRTDITIPPGLGLPAGYHEFAFGGTSSSTSVFAGLQADAQQAAGREAIGFANPIIYARYGNVTGIGTPTPGYFASYREHGTREGLTVDHGPGRAGPQGRASNSVGDLEEGRHRPGTATIGSHIGSIPPAAWVTQQARNLLNAIMERWGDIQVVRRDRLGGLLHEYSQVA
jgi:hypothetical protein